MSGASGGIERQPVLGTAEFATLHWGDGERGRGLAPPLAVVVSACDPWPAAQAALDALHAQVVAVGAELIVALGDTAARPPDAESRYPAIDWIESPGASVFRLRALGVVRSRAPIVAFTEDHARVTAGWCEAILAAHAARPEAAAVGGVVENGATRSLLDWASFFISNAPYLPPMAPDARAIALQANVSYKRRWLPDSGAADPRLGLMQHTFHEELRARGAVLVTDERLVVVHDQALGARGHSSGHFHNGRAIAAFRSARFGAARRALYACASLGLPPVMLWRTLRATAGKRVPSGVVFRSVPWLVWLLLCHAAGELLGYVAGPGSSPGRVK